MRIQEATGTSLRKKDLEKERKFFITDFGADESNLPIHNTKAINDAIKEAYKQGGGCVVIPKGIYKVYTIILKSNVNIKLEKGAVIQAARTNICYSYEKQTGEGGNYLEPEVNLYAGLQDHGHSYFANSLFYACEEENIMIYGEGKIDGSYLDTETGYLKYTLMGGDPFEPENRNEKGHKGEWFGNKGIALVRCKRVVLADFSFVIGGHFAIIAEGVIDLYVSDVLVDTTRDAFDIDCCQNITVVRSTFNSLTDDALVIKASYGAGAFMPAKNILIEDCTVSGYDAGSVFDGIYSCDKLVATDSCGPTGRVKLGTESTCGYEKVTVRRITFKRSRGFALEAVDGADLSDIIFEDSTMENVSSSPIFIRVGDRCRYPVTGISERQKLISDNENVRLDNKNWILPCTDEYQMYPPKRYVPSYQNDYKVYLDKYTQVCVVNQEEPAKINDINLDNLKNTEIDNKYYYGNACGSDHIAKVSDIIIRNIKITNADPRYPITIMGLMDSKIENIVMENIEVTYRGGLTMKHAVEQRQIFTNWKYKQYQTEEQIQTLPWLVNPFFAKNGGLLPRVEWDEKMTVWKDSPYNVPELPNVYPEPSNWGILPAYGLYIRHAKAISLKNISLNTCIHDDRDTIVLDDVENVFCQNISSNQEKRLICVENHYKRPTNKEFIKNEKYMTTMVKNLKLEGADDDQSSLCIKKENVFVKMVNAPEPGTPKDKCYPYGSIACPKTGFNYEVSTDEYSLPITVFRPFFSMPHVLKMKKGEIKTFSVLLRDPAAETTQKTPSSYIYNEQMKETFHALSGIKRPITISAEVNEEGICYDTDAKELLVDTTKTKNKEYVITLIADDNIIPEKHVIRLYIED